MSGNIAEVKYTQSANQIPRIKKISRDEYVVLATGEVKKFGRGESRLDDRQSLRESLTRLRDYLNANVTDASKARWVTLTYRELMSDQQRLYDDFKAFNRRCRKKYGHYEYIVAAEYQQRGSLHLHCVFVFDKNAPYMAGDEVASLWQQGFAKIRRLTSIDDVGRYITAYIGDAIIDQPEHLTGGVRPDQLKSVEVEENGVKAKKIVAKRARIAMMPSGFNLYRISKGIKPPTVSVMSTEQAEKMLQDWVLTYQAAYKLTDESRDFQSVMCTSYYNKVLGQREKELFNKAKQEQRRLSD